MFSAMWGLTKIKAQQAWDASTGGANVVVAVLDTGIDYNHPDLRNNLWTNTQDPVNGVDNDGNGYIDDYYGLNAITEDGNVSDDHGHGTHVAGTIGAGGNNGVGVTGVNWAVKLLPCKVLDAQGSGSVADSVDALDYLQLLKQRSQDPVNITVINASWAFDQYSYSLYDAIKMMGDTLFIAAAGNEARDNETIPSYPASYQLPNVISVAATTSNDTLASFSNYGTYLVDVAAPGEGILSTFPSSRYATSSGTSMATPHVSGLAALLKAQDPSRDGRKIKNLILSSGESLVSLQGKTVTGKRIDAAAATACYDKPLLTIGRLPSPVVSGNVYTLTARSINCEIPVGPVTVTTSAGQEIVLQDNGQVADAEAGDGVFSANWTPGTLPVTLTFSSPAGKTSLTLPPLKASFYLADARVNVPYYQPLQVEGDSAPYTWAIRSGALPAGLSLDPAEGAIYGAAAVKATSSFTVEVTDAHGDKASADVVLRVVTEPVDQEWGRTFGGDGKDRGNSVAHDAAGNYYVTGKTFNGQNYDLFVSKYDPAGRRLWVRTTDTGGEDTGYAVATDSNGNIVVLGTTEKFTSDNLLLKYTSAGELLWKYTFLKLVHQGLGHPSLAVGGNGNIYMASEGALPGGMGAVQLDALTPSGDRIWTRTHQDTVFTDARAVAVDGSGNVYFAGGRSKPGSEDFLLAKYDATGTHVWSRVVAEGLISALEGVAIDPSGNVVATGWTHMGSYSYGNTFKYDADGNLLWKTQSAPSQFPRAVSVTAAGIYVTGEQDRSATGTDFLTTKYDHSGKLVWERSLDAGEAESAYGIAADASGVTVVGYGERGENEEVIVARYSENAPAVADLSVTSFSASLSGSTLTYNVTVRNNGSGNVSPALGLYLSSDNVPSPADYAVTQLSVGTLAGGSERTLSGSVVAPVTIPSGNYYIAAIADPRGAVPETDETNNSAVTTSSYPFSASGSDLTITSVTGSVAAGAISYSVTVTNSGNQSCGSSTASLSLSTGGIVNQLTTVSVPALQAGGSIVINGSADLPPTLPQGDYVLVAQADSANVVAETNESNNGSSGNTVALTNDLIVSALSGTLNGGTLSYSITLRNLGNANANAPVSFYLSGDATASANDLLIRQLAAGSISGGSERTLTGTIAVPSSVPAGTYYFAALADPANIVAESVETNNGAVGARFSFFSDLQVTAFWATLSGGKINYSLTVKNAGNLASLPASSSIYLSSDAVASTSDPVLVSFITLALAPGAERTTVASVAIPSTVAPGSYRAAAIVDTTNLVAEWDETNNSAVGDLFPLSNDLSVTELSGTLSDGVLSYSLTVSNSGSGSVTVPVFLYFTPDAALSTNDLVIKQIGAVSVTSGTAKVVSGTLTIPSTVPGGTYYLGALADPANAIVEADEANNGSVAAGQFLITSDLDVKAVSATLAAGKLNYSVTLKNGGTVSTPSSKTGIYLSADRTSSSSDLLVGYVTTQAIVAGGERILTGSISVPSSIPPGS